MHHSPGLRKADASLEDGMLAPGIPLSLTPSMSKRPFSVNQTQGVLDASGTMLVTSNSMAQNSLLVHAKNMAPLEFNPLDEEDSLCPNGHTRCFCKDAENVSLIEEPKTEMEGFIMREHDIDVIREPVAEVNLAIKEVPDGYKNLQPILSSNQGAVGTANENLAPQKRRVQWVDNFGKDLVQVLEYEASDTGESEEEEDEADTHACTCTIQ